MLTCWCEEEDVQGCMTRSRLARGERRHEREAEIRRGDATEGENSLDAPIEVKQLQLLGGRYVP